MAEQSGGGIAPGTELNGIYVIDRRIARGGMGEVYAGHAMETGDKVAIKMILPEHAENELILSLFRKEAAVLYTLHNESIVRYFLFSVEPVLRRPYLVMEFADGPSLGAYLKRHGALGEEDLAVLRRRISSGLHAAHRAGVFHRDISPDNIILTGGTVEGAKIIDFGIAKQKDCEETLIGSQLAGKMNYISPEQLGLNGGEVTAQSDMYSFGLVLAEAATGKARTMTGSQLDIIEKRRRLPDLTDVPDSIRPLIQKMLAPKPDDRPADMSAVAEWGLGSERPARRGVALGLTVACATSAAVAMIALEAMEHAGLVQPDTPVASGDPHRLTAWQDEVIAPTAIVGRHYEWTSMPFVFTGEMGEIAVRTIGRIPPGLDFAQRGDGAVRFSGVPEDGGEFQLPSRRGNQERHDRRADRDHAGGGRGAPALTPGRRRPSVGPAPPRSTRAHSRSGAPRRSGRPAPPRPHRPGASRSACAPAHARPSDRG